MDAALLTQIAQTAGIAAAGFGLGILYFGGLWLTLRRLPNARHPQWLVFGSFLVRTLVCVAALYWLADGHWQRVVVMLVGFIIARAVLTRRLGAAPHAARPSVRRAGREG